jgi:hypothetical protein
MNRGIACLLFSLVSFLGCGARTGTVELGSGEPDGNGGTPNVGASAGSGATDGGFGASSGAPVAGAPNGASGGVPAAGAPSFGGFANVGGAPVAGAPSFAGFPNVAGAPSFGGFTSFGGAAGGPGGSGGEGGVIANVCTFANNACDKCLCTSCSTQVVGCFSDPQCTSIFACVVQTGCQGLGCFARNTCRNVIQNNGGLTGPAVGEVFSLVTCAVGSQTNCACN